MKKRSLFIVLCVVFAALLLVACEDKHTEHVYGEWSVTKASTCEEEGERQRTCTVCGEKQTETLAKIAHAFGEWSVSKEATCVEAGQRLRTCSQCGQSETETVALKPHTFDPADELFCTVCNTYYIASADNLRSLAAKTDFKDKSVVLTADIDLAGAEWTPLCPGTRSGSALSGGFNGIFDGNGKTVSGLKITADPANVDDGVGLFSAIKGGTVKNLTVVADISAPTNEMTGIIAGGMTEGLIENCAVRGSVASARGIGGIAGRVMIKGGVRGCVNEASVTGTNPSGNVGGIVGAMYYVGAPETLFIENCVNRGQVVSGGMAAGGVVGLLTCGRIQNCENFGEVSASGNSVGGIAGEAKFGAEIKGCNNSGAVSGGSFVGGVVGWVRYNKSGTTYDAAQKVVKIADCRNTARVSAKVYSLGGIVGGVYNNLEISGCENSGAVAGLADCYMIGGLIGNFQNLDDGNYFYNTGRLTAVNCVNKSSSVTQEKTPSDGMTHGIIGHVGENRVSFTGCTTVDEATLGTGIPA